MSYSHTKNENDKWVTVIGLGILLPLQLVTEKGIELPQGKMGWLYAFYGYASIIIIWMLIFGIVKKFRSVYPSISLSWKRFVTTCLVCIPVVFGLDLVVLYSGLLPGTENSPALTAADLIRNLTGVVLMIWIIAGMYEAGYYHHLLRAAQKERNDLLYLQMHHRLDDLKTRVNPHFLFNSLNTLSYLVYEDSVKAERFVEELSTVYRYLLRNNDEGLTTLEKEYAFIQSYVVLLKIRFGEGLQISFSIDTRLMQHRLPHLSLQVLVDNAVKYNTVSADLPLTISICAENEILVVKNSLQRKQQVVRSENAGLSYILSSYVSAGQKAVDVFETENQFIVKLPLYAPFPFHETIDKPMPLKNV